MSNKPPKQSTSELLAYKGRNLSVLGALALGGAALLFPGPNAFLALGATAATLHAAGFEAWRSHARRRSAEAQHTT